MTSKSIKTIITWDGDKFTTMCRWNHLGVFCPQLGRWFDWGVVKNSLDFD